MAAAHLSDQLAKLLRDRFIDDVGIADDLFVGPRPLGTFSARIDLAYLSGLISPSARRDLHLIRRIRNNFGHSVTALDFDDQSIAQRCRELYNHLTRRMRTYELASWARSWTCTE